MNIKRILFILFNIFILSTCLSFANPTVITTASLTSHTLTLTEGQMSGLGVKYGYIGSRSNIHIKWTSSNSKIARVSNGRITAVHAGKTKIKVTINNKVDTCEVTVKADTPVFINTQKCYTELNKYRSGSKLTRDKELEQIAKIRAKEMAVNNKFSHTRPNGKSGLTLIKGNKHKGENIAKGQKTAEAVTAAWYKSPGHRTNMLRPQFKKVGIAAYKYKNIIYWVQVFSS